MTDFLAKVGRSALMARVRSKGNFSTELRLVALFCKEEITGWRRSYPLFGKPDFIFPNLRLAVFRGRVFLAWLPDLRQMPAQQLGLLEREDRTKHRA